MLWKYLSKECSFNVLLNQARPLEENNRRVRDGPYYFFIERETEGGGGGVGARKGGWEIFEPLEFFWLTFPL